MDETTIAILLAEQDHDIRRGLATGRDVLGAASARLHSQPQTAHALLEIIADEQPQAAYLLAQLHAQQGAYTTALPLIETARAQFLAQGEATAAWRTVVGEMMVLGALGRHDDALTTATTALTALGEDAPLIRGKLHQNSGLILDQQGDFAAALSRYEAAATAFTDGGNDLEHSDILKNRGMTLLAMGDAREALNAFLQAASLLDERDQPLRQGRTFANIAYAHLLLGNYGESLTAFQTAREQLEMAGSAQYLAMLALDSADLHLTLNRTDDAIDAYVTAHAGLVENGMAFHIARALFGWGVALATTKQYDSAREKLLAASHAFAGLGNRPMVQRIAVELAGIDQQQGNNAAALSALATLQREHDLSDQTQFVALLTEADATDEIAARQAALQAAATISPQLPLPQLRHQLLWRRGVLAVALGDEAAAEADFRAAMDIVESLRGTLPQEALRISFVQDRLIAHRELLRLLLDQERVAEAWQLGEQIKARTLTEAQRQSVNQTQPDFAEQRQQLDALYNLLLDDGGATRRANTDGNLRERIRQLERQIDRQRQTLALPQPPLTPFVSDDIPTITYHLLGEELLAFVQAGESQHVIRALAQRSEIETALAEWAVQLRWMSGSPHFLARQAEQLTSHAKRILQQLYQLLFAPLEPLLAACGNELLIVPSDLLHHLPFHALHDGDCYLLERLTLHYAPSVTVYQLARRDEQPAYQHIAAFGVDDPALAHVSAEIAALIPHFATAEQFHNATATRQTVATCTAPVLHLATHGIFRSEHPLFSGLRLHDGWLTALDVAQLKLDNRLVVLSACESGRVQLAAGDEVLGLPHACLGAGARSVVASLWLVQDAVSAELMPHFYAELQETQNPATALRNAQLAMLAQRPHPYFWANFVLFGRGR